MAPQYCAYRDLGNTTEYNTSFPRKVTDGPSFPKINTCKVVLPETDFDNVRNKQKVSVHMGNTRDRTK